MKNSPKHTLGEPYRRLLSDADQCVKCGLCLPHCPTYGVSGEEGESPRGRISLVQGLVSGELTPTKTARRHLSRCLTCRACERVCPSNVPYGRIIDGGRGWLQSRRLTGRAGVFFRWLLSSLPVHYPKTARLVGFIARSRVLRGLRGSLSTGDGRLARWVRYLPSSRAGEWVAPGTYPALGEERARVGLFLGCVARVLEPDVLRDALTVANSLGVTVVVPQGQVCCGAIDLHGGDGDGALRDVRRNIRAFDSLEIDAVVTCASGCGATLVEYGEQEGLTDRERSSGHRMAGRVKDIADFLSSLDWPAGLRAAPLHGAVAVHEPCTLRNVMFQADGVYRLLEQIPGAELVPLADNSRCCGSAGTHMLLESDLADTLGDAKCRAIEAAGANSVVTSNVGCAIHLRARLRAAGLAVEVIHPVSLLARHLAESDARQR